ncbi:MAG TPA: YCF48-related protein, partial [Thermoleophilia bacterium]|nr:YCF48-related protein [Thermoleophilia bacterium]
MRRVHVVLSLGALLVLPAMFAAETPAGTSEWGSPLMLEDGAGLHDQYGYLPEYTRHVPAFDAAGHSYIRSRASNGARSSYVHTLQEGGWRSLDFEGALRAAYSDYTGTVGAAGLRSDRIVFDEQDRAYNPLTIRLKNGSTRNVLMVSWDHCHTWSVFELPAGQFAVEHWVGHNEIDGPPFLAYWQPYAPSKAYNSNRNSLWVTKPRLDGKMLVIPTPTLVTRECLGLNKDSGGASFAVTQGDKTTFVWAEATPVGTKATPQYVATYDHATGVVSRPELLAATRPANDTHNKPGLCSDGQGYIHFVAGTHGSAAVYRRTLQPYEPSLGWTPPEPALRDGYVVDERVPSVQEARQTYDAFVCDSNDTLHLVTRQWRRGVDTIHDGRAYGALIHQARPRDGVWSVPTVILTAAAPGYGVFFHKLALDRRDRLFLSCSYSGGIELKEHETRSAAQARLGRSETVRGKYLRRMLLVSDDGGSGWRFADNRDLAAEGEAAPRAWRVAPSEATEGVWPIASVWSWVQPRPQGNQLTAVDFVNRSTGWAVGTYGTILRSSDGGATWRSQTSGTTANLYDVAAIDGRTAWAVGQGGLILRTGDGGRTWQAQDAQTLSTFFSIAAPSVKRAWAVGDHGLVRVTADGGKTWRRQYSKTSQPLFSVTFLDGSRGWAGGGGGRLLSTRDGGRHWLLQRTMINESLHAIAFVDSWHGVAAGAGGSLLVSSDGGGSWRRSLTAHATSLRAVKMVSRNLIYATGSAGAFLRSRDGGR